MKWCLMVSREPCTPGRDVSQLPSVPIKVSTPSLDYMILGHFHTSNFPSSELLKDLTIAALFL